MIQVGRFEKLFGENIGYIPDLIAEKSGIADYPEIWTPYSIRRTARSIYCRDRNAISGSLLLDQSPLNSGTRRTGEEGRCYLYDGVDDYSTLDAGFTASGDFTLSFNINATSFASPFHVFIASTTSDRIYFNNGTSFNIVANGTLSGFTLDAALVAGTWYNILVRRVSGTITVYVDGVAQSDTEANAQDLDFLYFSRGGADPLNAKLFDVRYFNSAITDSQLNYVVSFGRTGTPVTPTNWWKCDEQSGTVGYDSVGGNHLTHNNITEATFHATQDIWSFQNQVGYNTSGAVYIPRDESDPTNDVLGNPLTNTGRRPNDASLHSSNCLTADGTLYIAAAHLAGTETVVSSGGTSTPSISAGRIDFTAGTCWDLTLSDGTHYPLSEGWGVDIGSSTSDNDGVLTNSVLANAWGATQNEYHYNLISGFSLYEHASTAAIRWPFKNGSVKTLTPPTGYSKTSDNPPGDYHNNAETLIDLDPDSTPEMGAVQLNPNVYQTAQQVFTGAQAANITGISFKFRSTDDAFLVFNDGNLNPWLLVSQDGSTNTQIFRDSGNPILFIDGSSDWGATRDDLHTALCDGLVHDVVITNLDMTVDASWALNGVYVNSYTGLEWDSTTYLWDLQATGTGDLTPIASIHSDPYIPPSSLAFGDAMDSRPVLKQGWSRNRDKTQDRFVIMADAQWGSSKQSIDKYTQP